MQRRNGALLQVLPVMPEPGGRAKTANRREWAAKKRQTQSPASRPG